MMTDKEIKFLRRRVEVNTSCEIANAVGISLAVLNDFANSGTMLDEDQLGRLKSFYSGIAKFSHYPDYMGRAAS